MKNHERGTPTRARPGPSGRRPTPGKRTAFPSGSWPSPPWPPTSSPARHIPATTLAKFLYEHARASGPRPGYALQSGEVVVVDEASQVCSADFARLVDLAGAAGAKIVAVGDYRQLGAVDAGGLFHLLANDAAAVELTGVWRFSAEWERSACLRLRSRDRSVLYEYEEHGRLHGGTREETIEAAFERWTSARAAGESVVAMAPDHATADAFALRVRAMRSRLGEVEPTGLEIGGQLVGAGDEIVTTRNDRRLVTDNGHWVRNGDRWTVERRTSRGHLRVRSLEGRGRVRLPRPYVEEDVALAYAVTTHKAQGVTVDRGLLLADDATSDLSLYVGMTRGRHSNDVFVGADPGIDYGPADDPTTPVTILEGVLRRDTSERSATEVLRDVLDEEESIETLQARLDRIDGHVISEVGLDEDRRRTWLDDHPDADRIGRDLQRRLDEAIFGQIDIRTIELPGFDKPAAAAEPRGPEPDLGLSW